MRKAKKVESYNDIFELAAQMISVQDFFAEVGNAVVCFTHWSI